MATTNCPNCGKPLRPGARFCGSCGHVIEATPSNQADVSPAAGVTIACPQCGKPVRVGAKFCSNCGKVLQPEPVPPAAELPSAQPIETPLSEPPVTPAAQAQPVPVPTAKPPAGAVPDKMAAPVQRKTGEGKKMIWPLLIFILMLICVLVVGAAYVYVKDPFGWFASSQASPPPSQPSQTPQPAASATVTKLELATQNPPTLTSTIPVEPVATVAPTAILEISPELSPTILSTPATPLTGTAPIVAPAVLLNDYFTSPLNVNWKAWGDPRPIIRSGPGNNWLELPVSDKPGTAGVTSRMEIASAPGNAIEFEGQLNTNYANYSLFFDWDPVQFDRGPENINPTILHLEIQNGRIVLQAPAANNTCQKEFEGAKQHRYILKFVGEKQVVLYIDGVNQPLCQVDLGIKAVPGRISFTGTGWVSHVLVTGANLP